MYIQAKAWTDLIRANFVVNLLDANLPCAYITTFCPEILHACQSQLPQVAMLHTRAADNYDLVFNPIELKLIMLFHGLSFVIL